MVCGIFQFAVVKLSEEVETDASVTLEIETGIVTAAVGWLERLTVKVSVVPFLRVYPNAGELTEMEYTGGASVPVGVPVPVEALSIPPGNTNCSRAAVCNLFGSSLQSAINKNIAPKKNPTSLFVLIAISEPPNVLNCKMIFSSLPDRRLKCVSCNPCSCVV